MKNYKLDQIEFDTATDDQMKADLLEKRRTLLPELTDENPAGVFVRILDHVARFFGRWCRQFVNTIANELFLPTAQTHDGITEGCRRVGYLIEQVQPARATVTLTINPAIRQLSNGIILQRGTHYFETARHADGSDPVRFEMEDDQFVIPAGTAGGISFALDVVQGRTVTGEILGTSNGESYQEYYTLRGGVIRDSVAIRVAGVTYTRTENLLLADPWDTVFGIRRYTEDNQAIISFGNGDGVSSGHGQKPASGALIVTDYRIIPEGENGNVGPGTITRIRPNLSQLSVITNVAAASGYTAREENENAKWNAERYARTRDSLGRLEDYEAAAEAVDGIGRAYAVAREFGENTIGVHCILSDGEYPDRDDLDLVDAAISLLPSGATARSARPDTVTLNITALVEAQAGYVTASVLTAVEAALEEYFDPLNKDDAGNWTCENGMSVYPALMYRIIMSVAGVGGCVVQAPTAPVTANSNQIPVLGTVSIMGV